MVGSDECISPCFVCAFYQGFLHQNLVICKLHGQFSQEEGVLFVWDLFWFKVFSFFNTRSGMIIIFDKISPLNSSVGSGISIFSTVNMLLDESFSAFALSHGDTAFVAIRFV